MLYMIQEWILYTLYIYNFSYQYLATVFQIEVVEYIIPLGLRIYHVDFQPQRVASLLCLSSLSSWALLHIRLWLHLFAITWLVALLFFPPLYFFFSWYCLVVFFLRTCNIITCLLQIFKENGHFSLNGKVKISLY